MDGHIYPMSTGVGSNDFNTYNDTNDIEFWLHNEDLFIF